MPCMQGCWASGYILESRKDASLGKHGEMLLHPNAENSTCHRLGLSGEHVDQPFLWVGWEK